ncbi:hypothetical protein DL96DRAFT_1816536 [Flagelloscypha sp. PMI_526]|nr:hypothetical protein DL96DRAFT_1816536 [Flagelloscypha sp. PMI_526]
MPVIPPDLYDAILGFIPESRTLKRCSFVNRDFRPHAQAILFERVVVRYKREDDFTHSMSHFLSAEIPYNIITFLSSRDHSHLCIHIRQLFIVGLSSPADVSSSEAQSKQLAELLLPRLANVRYFDMRSGLLDNTLRDALVRHIFPKITFISWVHVERMLDIFSLLRVCVSLRHLKVVVGGLRRDASQILPSEVDTLAKLYSLKVRYTENGQDSQDWLYLEKVSAAVQQSLKIVELDPVFWGEKSSTFKAPAKMLNHCSRLTHLHMGSEVWNQAGKHSIMRWPRCLINFALCPQYVQKKGWKPTT